MGFEDLLDNPAFWILGGGGIAAELLGYVIGKNMGFEAFPLWQLIIIMAGTLAIAAFFANQ